MQQYHRQPRLRLGNNIITITTTIIIITANTINNNSPLLPDGRFVYNHPPDDGTVLDTILLPNRSELRSSLVWNTSTLTLTVVEEEE